MTATVRRHTIGVIALAMLVAAAVLLLFCDGNLADMYGSICLRVGMALGATWLAFPQILLLSAYCSPRMLFTCLLGGIILIARPKAFPIVALLIGAVVILEIAGWLLKPLRPPDKPSQGKGRG